MRESLTREPEAVPASPGRSINPIWPAQLGVLEPLDPWTPELHTNDRSPAANNRFPKPAAFAYAQSWPIGSDVVGSPSLSRFGTFRFVDRVRAEGR